MSIYCEDFYKEQIMVSKKSAVQIVPLVLDLINPKNIIDIGCGIGAWLSVFHNYGISDYIGVDGDWINSDMLCIRSDRFVRHDLAYPLKLNRKFDLVVSLEIGEHLPAEAADIYINTLTGLGDIILFSAAIPNQGGTNHINEQWPDYWKRLFNNRGYILVDCLREKIWNNNQVAFWFAQNLLIYVKKEKLIKIRKLNYEYKKSVNKILNIVHPDAYLMHCSR